MTDTEKIEHSAACLREIRRIAEALQNAPEEKKDGYARKMHQLAGYCLDRLGGVAGPKVERKNVIHSSEVRGRVLARRAELEAAKNAATVPDN